MILSTREQRRQMARENAKQPTHLVEVPESEWPLRRPPGLERVLRSRDFLVQLFDVAPPALARMTANRTTLDGTRWSDGITWDELQRLKSEAGYADAWAIEIFPPNDNVVCAANMRHLWMVPAALLPFAWNNEGTNNKP